ncbi:MAG: LPS export ABC transporter periplasmic protein LptC [Selenomonadaceae bacterium]|nr:LPS export ABC transporter periplasmic protein LptC [Selenomonadaceae bacterium]
MKLKKICAIICATMLINATALSAENNSPSEVKADEIDYDMDTGKVIATGSVFMRHEETAASNDDSNVPSEVNADTVDYDMNTGVVTAEGNVHLKYGTGTATGSRAMYNTNTQEAYLIGNVIVIRDDMKIICDSLTNDGAGRMQASGNVDFVQNIAPNAKYPKGETRTFKGEHVDYYPDDRKHVIIPTGGIVTSNDGTFTANYMEGWVDEEYYIGTGNVHIVNPPREMEAGGDRIDYFAQDNGKAILTGNAWVVQKNNTMRGNRLTVYLADNQKNPAASKSNSTSTKTQILPHEVLTNAPFQN